jgi:hypothetical protein
MELAQDLKAIHGLDAETELANILSAEILAEINREIVRTINVSAVRGSASGTTTAGIFDLDTDSNGRWSVEKFKGLMFHIEREANKIAKDTRRGKGNLIICSSDVAAALLAIPLYSFSLFQMGLSLMFFFTSLLMTGWILGIFIIVAIIRFGVAAESLAWGAIFTLAPLSAVYYPVETLPEWIRWLSLSFPQTYVFEGMREVLFSNNFNSNYFIKSIILNIIYAIIAVIVFLVSFEGARKRGGLINTGE